MNRIDEADAQADDENFDPSIKQRDYEEVGRSLPVFCVSSKAVCPFLDTTIKN